MNQPTSNALAITGPLLRILQWINGLYALAIACLVVFCVFRPDFMYAALKVQAGSLGNQLAFCLLAICVLGIAGAGLVNAVLRHLRAMIGTVRAGDPFVASNARRLQVIAWLVMAGEFVRLAVAAVVTFAKPIARTLGIHVDISAGVQFSLAPWLSVLLLFVLAGVFAHGTRLRDDLEGTV
jgi:hypothetical protein